MLKSKSLKNCWKRRKEYAGYDKSFYQMLVEEARHADPDPKYRDEGLTYADAAYLLLERKGEQR